MVRIQSLDRWRLAVRAAMLTAVAAAAVLNVACLWSQEAPSLKEAGRVELAEPPGHPLEAVRTFHVTARYMLVADRARVHLYDRQGKHLSTFGREGAGPGEFQAVAVVFALGDTLVGVADDGQRRISLLSIKTGAVTGGTLYGGVVRSVAVAGDRVWFGGLDPQQLTGVFGWSLGTDAPLVRLGKWPDAYRRSAPLAGINTGVAVAPRGDGVAYGFSGSNTLVAADAGGAVLLERDVPARRRRGVPADIVNQLELAHSDFERMFSLNSVLFNMARLPSGHLALVHYDQVINGKVVSATAYLSVVRPDLDGACVDALVPTSGDSQPSTAFWGDTLFVLEQEVRGESAVAVVSAYRIDYGKCRWLPMRAPPR